MASLTDQDLPSDSDDSDVDFKPSGDEGSAPSEEDSDGSVEEPALDNNDEPEKKANGKRKKKETNRRKKGKKRKVDSCSDSAADEKVEEEGAKKLSPEEEKQKADALWNDFMKDSVPPIRKVSTEKNSNIETNENKPLLEKKTVIEKENKAVIEEIFEFAGEKIRVEKEVPAPTAGRGRGGFLAGRGRGRGGGGGLAALVGQLGKKNKLSTLEKSKLDWDRFKKHEGIEEDIQTHNKGKEGYLEKQDFLQRTDLRQFEIEKQLRTTSRKSNR